MRTTIWRLVVGVQCASSSLTGRPTARAATLGRGLGSEDRAAVEGIEQHRAAAGGLRSR